MVTLSLSRIFLLGPLTRPTSDQLTSRKHEGTAERSPNL